MVNKVLLCLDSRQPGGIETHVIELAKGIQRHSQWAVEIVFLTDFGPHPLWPILQRMQLPFTVLDGRFRSFLDLVKQSQARVLHSHGYKAGWYCRLASILSPRATFSTFHMGERGHGRLAWYDRLDRYSAYLNDRVYAVSPAIQARVPRAHLQNNFIDCTGVSASHGEDIAFVGRLSPEKGPERFVALSRHFPQQHFHLFGDGPLRAKLQADAPANCHFHGMQTNMSDQWQNIGVLLITSYAEGLPMVALEAMARGIVVISFALGALPTLITDQVNGFLLAPNDSEGMQACLQTWLTLDKTHQQTLKHAAQQRILSGYSSAAIVPQIITEYEQKSIKY